MSSLNIDDFEDQQTWDLISSGRTKGVFQLESKLGSSWAKRAKPRNIEELADLISIIRPGTLEAMLDGKSMTKHYVDRKSKLDEVKFLDPALEPLLGNTYGIIVYQEQAMKIASVLAGFTPEEADSLRKAMGKKDAALMNEVGQKFINGCKAKGIVTEQSAGTIFNWIQASARYSFNKSHAVAYAINSFRSAYCKVHRPLKFYETYLNHAHNKPDKQKELKEVIMDARMHGIEVYPPRLKHFHKKFTMDKDKDLIYFGFSNVKYVGEGEQEKLNSVIEEAEKISGKKLEDFNWLDCLFHIGARIKTNAFISLISVGGMNGKNNNKTRNSMIFEFGAWNSLTQKEKKWIHDYYCSNGLMSLQELVKIMINKYDKINTRRMKSVLDIYSALSTPAYSLEDSIEWIADIEEKLMGCSLSCAKIDSSQSMGHDIDVTCKDIVNGTASQCSAIAVKITECKDYTIKSGKSMGKIMGFISGEDHSGLCDSFIVFPDEYSKFKKLLFSGNTVLLSGEIKQRGKDLSFIVNKVKQV